MEVPDDLRNLRACLNCGMIKTTDQFVRHGCDNCPDLAMMGDKERVFDASTTNFDGVIAMMDTGRSWVARWQHIRSNRLVAGVYAITLHTRLPSFLVKELEEKRGVVRRVGSV